MSNSPASQACEWCGEQTDGTDHNAACPLETVADVLDEFGGDDEQNTRTRDFRWAAVVLSALNTRHGINARKHRALSSMDPRKLAREVVGAVEDVIYTFKNQPGIRSWPNMRVEERYALTDVLEQLIGKRIPAFEARGVRTPEQIALDIGEALMESGIGIGTHGDVNARMRQAAEMEAKEWEAAYRQLYKTLAAAARPDSLTSLPNLPSKSAGELASPEDL